MLSVVIVNVVMLNVVMLSVIMLNVIMLNVVMKTLNNYYENIMENYEILFECYGNHENVKIGYCKIAKPSDIILQYIYFKNFSLF
jgi:hypothetical protein